MLNELKSNHREIARLKFEGVRPTEIAAATGMSISTVRGVLADPMCKAHIAKLSDKADLSVIDVRKKLAEMNAKALDTLDDLLTHADVPAAVQLKTAQDVLNRNGFAPVQEHRHMSVHITSEDLAEMKRRALTSGAVIANEGYEDEEEEII